MVEVIDILTSLTIQVQYYILYNSTLSSNVGIAHMVLISPARHSPDAVRRQLSRHHYVHHQWARQLQLAQYFLSYALFTDGSHTLCEMVLRDSIRSDPQQLALLPILLPVEISHACTSLCQWYTMQYSWLMYLVISYCLVTGTGQLVT